MVAIIHIGKCDQAEECECPKNCPQNAWQRINDKWVIDEKLCNNCGNCLKFCPAEAIMIAHDNEEKVKILNQIKNDKIYTPDRLFVERYGAMPINKEFFLSEKEFLDRITTGIHVVEVFNDESIECLTKCVPYFNFLNNDIDLIKVMATSNIVEKFGIITCPSLLIIRDNELVGKIDGHCTDVQKLNNFIISNLN